MEYRTYRKILAHLGNKLTPTLILTVKQSSLNDSTASQQLKGCFQF